MPDEVFRVGGAEARRGEKGRGFLEVAGTGVRMPVTVVHGARPGPTVLITAGVHGGEYPGIEAAIRTARELDPAEVAGRVTVVHIVSPLAFYARQQYVVPQDGKNPNRVFPGNALGSVSERMAFALMEQAATQADFWIDLHGGDIHEALVPFTIYSGGGAPEVRERARAMAEVYGIPYVVVSNSIAGGTYGAAAARGIPCILTEAGGEGRLDEESTRIHQRGIRNVLRHLGVLPGQPEAVAKPAVLNQFLWLRAEHAGCWYPQVKVGERVREGQPVGSIRDEFGEPLAEFRAPASGVVLFAVTSLAINPNDPLLAVGA